MLDPKDIGTRWDPPAAIEQLYAPPLDPSVDPPTLFALLKGILLQLMAMTDN